jgi:SAM-dependent methyltransferase
MSITACRSCGHRNLAPILSLGHTPLANAFLTAEQLGEAEPTYPLDLVFCPACTLVQITETVPPELLFSEYLYFSSYSETVLQQARELAERLIAVKSLDSHRQVVEIASNDGYLLQYYHAAGIPVLGIEPASNIANVARERGISTMCHFFGRELGHRLQQERRQADIVHANNVLAHVADLNGFVAGIHSLLKPEGWAVIEVPYLKELIDHGEFDTIYHEHLCYFSLTALSALFERHQLSIGRVERLPIHGGSLRLFVSRVTGAGQFTEIDRATVTDIQHEEVQWGVDQETFYRNFGSRIEQLRQELTGLLHHLKSEGNRIAAYGASAKGSTLLNVFGIGSDLLDFVVDRNPNKQGRFTPGTHLPIYAPAKLLEAMPAYVLLLTWNFADEILRQQSEYRNRGGRFINFVPHVEII